MEKSDKRNWIYGIIALLLLALVVETGFLISQAGLKPEQPIHSSPKSEYFPSPPPDYQGQWDPLFEEIQRFQEELTRSVNEGVGRMMRSPTFQQPMANLFQPGEFAAFSPAIDLQETETAYVAKADLPGLEKEKIDVSVSGNVLTISGERKGETRQEDAQQGFYTTERSYGSFSRSISLPGPVDEGGIVADYRDGVLTVTLPKAQGTQATKQVPVA
jgi:HSP20 family protein